MHGSLDGHDGTWVPVDVVYLDFKKAFDSVPHERLLGKLKAYGIGGKLHAWISDFLKGRRQRVNVEGEFSGWMNVDSGIPQDSVLGPLCFLIFVDDIPSVVSGPMKLFADDTKLYGEGLQLEASTHCKWILMPSSGGRQCGNCR